MDLTNPQSLNRYSYVLHNPVRFTDPTGLVCGADYGLGETPCNPGNSGGGGGSGSFAGYGEFGLMGIPVVAVGDGIYGYLKVPIMSDPNAGIGGVSSINELLPVYGPQSFATDFTAFDLVGTSFLSSASNAWQTMTSQIAKYVPQVCSEGGFGYAAANIPLAPQVGIESVGLVEYDSKDGGSHGGLLGVELGPTVLGVESIRTWKDWQAHTGPIGIAGDEFHAASQMFGKNVQLGTFDGGGFVNWMDGQLNIGGYLGGKIFGGGGYVSLSWSGCR